MKAMRIHEASNTAVIPYDADVATALADRITEVTKGDNKYLLIPARPDELKILKNCGFEPEGMYDYNWTGMKPFDSQKETARLLVESPRAYVLSEMGTGKTLASLFAFDYLRKHGIARRMLVVAPLSTLTTAWEREVFQRMPHLSTQSLWHPQKKKRLQALSVDADIFIINHDGVSTIREELMARDDIDVVLVDELAILRNASTIRWKSINLVCKNRRFVWGMTGSPTPKAPTDAWAQIKLLTPYNTTKFFKQFRDSTMQQISEFKWLPRDGAKDTVYAQMQPAVRYTREQCLDLPETMRSTRYVAQSPAQAKVYNAMLKTMQADYNAGTMTAANAGIQTGKLLQISCGFGYDADGVAIHLPSDARVNELIEVVQESSNKVIVFTPFVEMVKHLNGKLCAEGIDSAQIWGAVKKNDRDHILSDFQHSPRIKALIAHPQCMAHGLTLTAADTIVWYGPTPSLEIYEQACARITRPGQKNRTHIIHIESTDIERRIYRRLEGRADAQRTLLDMFEEMDK